MRVFCNLKLLHGFKELAFFSEKKAVAVAVEVTAPRLKNETVSCQKWFWRRRHGSWGYSLLFKSPLIVIIWLLGRNLFAFYLKLLLLLLLEIIIEIYHISSSMLAYRTGLVVDFYLIPCIRIYVLSSMLSHCA